MIVPSIDLMDGKVVQLVQGKEKALEREDHMELARNFDRCCEIAVIDLDAALSKGNNGEIIKQICSIADCRVGGGIRSIDKAKEVISWGAKKVIIGTLAFKDDVVNHDFLNELVSTLGRERIIIAVDAWEQEIVIKGWTHKTGLPLLETVKDIECYCSEFLFTCVEKEGKLEGTDMETLERLLKVTDNKITLAGGITTIDEISTLARMGVDAQIGMALYTGKIRLEDAFIESLNWKSELIPTITCNQSGQVLMLAYNNKESLMKTFETGKATYFSRSRNELWTKGETSGNVQEFVKMRADCDKDALLMTVRQSGVACHTGSYSCFGEKLPDKDLGGQ